jgi:hypothetical protein
VYFCININQELINSLCDYYTENWNTFFNWFQQKVNFLTIMFRIRKYFFRIRIHGSVKSNYESDFELDFLVVIKKKFSAA